jgi:hypothetical protein
VTEFILLILKLLELFLVHCPRRFAGRWHGRQTVHDRLSKDVRHPFLLTAEGADDDCKGALFRYTSNIMTRISNHTQYFPYAWSGAPPPAYAARESHMFERRHLLAQEKEEARGSYGDQTQATHPEMRS